MRRCIDELDATARASGARIVHCCGFDSIPSDLGTLLVADHAGGDLLDLDPDTINPLDVTARLRLVEDKVIRTMRGSIGFEHFEIRLVD